MMQFLTAVLLSVYILKKGNILMKIGVCASPNHLPIISELHYEYIETNFSWIADMDENTFREQTAFIEKYAVPSEAFNIFFRGGMKLYAPDGNQDPLLSEIATFARTGFSRAATWGGKVAVIGSGFVRGIPDGMTREETETQFARVLEICGEEADRYGMKIVVEPLSRTDCNYIHTVAEGVAAARKANHPAVGVLVDFYHHWKNNDDMDSLTANADILYHAHYGRPEDRNVPQEEDKESLFQLAAILKKCSKMDRISLECSWKPDFETAITAARPLMEVFR